jgi:hypothetical protein
MNSGTSKRASRRIFWAWPMKLKKGSIHSDLMSS